MATRPLPLPEPIAPPVPAPARPWALWPLVVLFLPVLLIPYLAVPLDRDEGEYAYAADLWLRGGLPYRDTFLQKPPGIVLAYAGIFQVFGTSGAAIHAALLLVYAATAFLLGLLAHRLAGPRVAVLAVGAFALSLTSALYGGQSANTEAFMLLPLVGAALCLTRPSLGTAMGAGLLIGVALCFKQVAGVTIPVALGVLLTKPDRGRLVRAFLVAVVLPFTLTLVWAASHQILPPYLDAVLWHDLAYIGGTLEPHGWPLLRAALARFTPFDAGLWGLALVAAVLLRRHRAAVALVGWLAAALLAISLGQTWREHYWLQALPAVCLLAAWGLARLGPILRPSLLAGLLVAALTSLELFVHTPASISDRRYRSTRFIDAVPLGQWLGQWPDSSLYVLGSEPELYHYAGRRSPSRYVIFTPLFGGLPDSRARQAEVWRDLTTAPPFQVVVSRPPSTLPAFPRSDLWLAHRLDSLLARDYRQVLAHGQRDTLAVYQRR